MGVWPQVITGLFTIGSVVVTLVITRRGTVRDRDVVYRRDVLRSVFTDFLSAAAVLSRATMDTYTKQHPLTDADKLELDQARHQFLMEYQGSRAAITIYAPNLDRALQHALQGLDVRAVEVANETISHAQVTSRVDELDALAQAMRDELRFTDQTVRASGSGTDIPAALQTVFIAVLVALVAVLVFAAVEAR